MPKRRCYFCMTIIHKSDWNENVRCNYCNLAFHYNCYTSRNRHSCIDVKRMIIEQINSKYSYNLGDEGELEMSEAIQNFTYTLL